MHKTSSPYIKELYKGRVKWMPFNTRTLKYAQHKDMIIFIHIGYIGNIEEREKAYELFKNKDVANIINKNFVPVAVDLEDVPEALLIGLDLLIISEHTYSIPINIFSLPGAKPFTSFSNTSAEEFIKLAQNVIYSFKEQRSLLNKAGGYMSNRLKGTGIVLKKESAITINHKLLHLYVTSWMNRYVTSRRRENKSPYNLNSRYYVFLLKYAKFYNNKEYLDFLEKGLNTVYYSGAFDPIEGGIFSQVTNTTYKEPLYEKQLSENIQAAVLYSFAYKYFGHEHYKEAAIKIIEFIESTFKSQHGGYMTSVTLSKRVKDSTYYKYSLDELSGEFKEDYRLVASALGMSLNKDNDEQQVILNTSQYNTLPHEYRARLQQIREQKSQEKILDTRIVTAYNCMYATSLCIIGNNIPEKLNEYLAKSEEIIDVILDKQQENSIKLYRYISNSQHGGHNAQLLDYTFFLNALLNIYKHTYNNRYSRLISKYTAYIMLNYYQSYNGMFSKTTKTEEITPYKRESIIDYIRYSANSVMARNLWILYRMHKDEFYLKAFKQQLYNVAPQIIGTGPLMVGWALQILNYLSDKSDYD